MRIRRTILGTALLDLILLAGFAQAQPPGGIEIPGDRSFYLNQPVDKPESLSGVWEASVDSGGAVGIQLLLGTMVSGDADPPSWTPQSWQHLELGVFQRKGPELVFGEENFFSDSPRGGSLTLENDRLQLHFAATVRTDLSFDLDLTRESDGCWRGRFHRGDFDSSVILCRPGHSAQSPSKLAGTWSSPTGECLHIFPTQDGFTGWSDALQVPGRISFGSNVPGPHLLYQQYGALAKVRFTNDHDVSIELNAFSALCCPRQSELELSADGSTLQPKLPHDSSSFRFNTWTKIEGDSCVDPVSVSKLHPAMCTPAEAHTSVQRSPH